MGKVEGLHVVTGAFGYTGRWIAHYLLEKGAEVRTLTNSIGGDDPFDGQANICIDQGQLSENTVVDAAGPDTFEYREFLDILSKGMGRRNILIPIPDWLTLMVGQFMGLLLQDIVITEAEIRGLRQGLAASSEEPLGTTSFRDWAEENGDDLGRIYRNDIKIRKYVK